MPHPAAKVTQADIVRAICAAKEAGAHSVIGAGTGYFNVRIACPGEQGFRDRHRAGCPALPERTRPPRTSECNQFSGSKTSKVRTFRNEWTLC